MLKNIEGKYFTLKEYKEHVEKTQKDKDKKLVYLYTNDVDSQHSYIEAAKERGYDILIMDGVLDNHFINTIEQKFSDSTFKRVDSDTIDNLVKKEDNQVSKLDEKQKEELKVVIEKNINKEKFTVVFENLSEGDIPFMIVQPEFMRRMKDMSALGGGMAYMGNMPEQYNLVVNSNNPIITKILNDKESENQSNVIKQIYDLALLSQNLLKGQEMTDFIKRSVDIIK